MRVAVYTRVSTSEQSTDMQRSEIDRYLGYHSLTNVTYYDDSGFSGTIMDRPQLNRMLSDVKNGAIDMVIIWKFDRLFRNLRHLTGVMQDFQAKGVKFMSIKDNVDLSTHTGKLMMHIIGAFAEFEVENTRDRVRSGIKQAREAGVVLGRPKEIEWIHEAILSMRDQGHSYSDICETLGVSRAMIQRVTKRP